MHTLHLYFSPSQVLIYFLNFRNDVSDFIFDGRLFHIFGTKDLQLSVPNLLVFIRLTMMSFCLTFKFSLGLNIFFMLGWLISFRDLNILTALKQFLIFVFPWLTYCCCEVRFHNRFHSHLNLF